MKLPAADNVVYVPLGVALGLLVVHASWPAVAALALAVVLLLGCRLIAYRQAEDVSALAKRLEAVEQEAKRALIKAEVASTRKAPGY